MMHGNMGETSRARRTHTRGVEWDFPEDLDPAFLVQMAEHWRSIENDISALQDQKKAMLATIRSRFGRHQAEAVKIAMRIVMMDDAKRTEHMMFNETACRYAVVILDAMPEEGGYDA